MTEHLVPVVFALFLWWFSTGAIIYLDGLPKRTFRWSMMALSGLLVLACIGIYETRDDMSVHGAYLSFTSGLIVWAWLEMAFYAGYITGPRRTACGAECSGPRHVWHAIETILYNQIGCLIAGVAIAAVTWSSENQIALWTFVVLWALQQSAKLNVFLGVRNLNEDFLPEHMGYLKRYMTERPMNGFFPISVTIGTVACAGLIYAAHTTTAGPGHAVGLALIATMLVLAILEHWFLVLPIPAERLWAWSMTSRRTDARATTEPSDDNRAAIRLADAPPDWSADLPQPCDASALKGLLDAIARGRFGDIRTLNGIARADTEFVELRVAHGAAHITPYAHSDAPKCEARVFGSVRDDARLLAAFQACISRRFAT